MLDVETAPKLPSTEAEVIANRDFCSQLNKLRSLRSFVITQNIRDQSKSGTASVDIGELNSFRYGGNGRQPSDDEWDNLSVKLQYLYGLLNETERRKFHFTLTAPMLKWLPTVLVIAALVFLIVPSLYGYIRSEATPWVYFSAFLLWTLVVGALGAIAFILVNALGIQVDPTVDVVDQNSMLFRVLLGALFSVLLTFPFGYQPFYQFNMQILAPPDKPIVLDPKQAVLLFMPFLFGFSTSLVLTVLNRLVESVQTFFGVSTKK